MNKNKNKKKTGFLAKAMSLGAIANVMATGLATTVFADGDWDSVNVGNSSDGSTVLGKIVGMLVTISKYVGIALVVYGAYEIVMSFMQNQPEAKTKGVLMAICGCCLIAMKAIVTSLFK